MAVMKLSPVKNLPGGDSGHLKFYQGGDPMDVIKLKQILCLHDKYLHGVHDGQCANLRNANLEGANLEGADLEDADLEGANLRNANLECANLRNADLRGANLEGANLEDANLECANLEGANLEGANLRNANLEDANLEDANLEGANLRNANLEDAKLEGDELPPFQICPEVGEFIAWKKLNDGVLAKLRIPDSAKRTSSLIGRKCRASEAVVLEMFRKDSGEWQPFDGTAHDRHTTKTEYAVGLHVKPDSYDDDIRVECTHGIHFFITRQEAERW